MWERVLAVLMLAIVAGCAPAETASPGEPLSPAEARYRLIDQVGTPSFCDPDEYPVGRDEMASMRERFPEIERDGPTMTAILDRLGLDPTAARTDDERLAIYREWKLLNAIGLGDPTVAFDILIDIDPQTETGTRVTGTIAPDGTITIDSETPGAVMSCPICLARGTRIATPTGEVPIEDLRAGQVIWTVDVDGRRLRATVERVGRSPTPIGHQVIRLELRDGRTLTASPGHPLLDGRRLGELRIGDAVDGSTVMAVERRAYADDVTFDLLAAGPTGGYIADGIALASTLR